MEWTAELSEQNKHEMGVQQEVKFMHRKYKLMWNKTIKENID